MANLKLFTFWRDRIFGEWVDQVQITVHLNLFINFRFLCFILQFYFISSSHWTFSIRVNCLSLNCSQLEKKYLANVYSTSFEFDSTQQSSMNSLTCSLVEECSPISDLACCQLSWFSIFIGFSLLLLHVELNFNLLNIFIFSSIRCWCQIQIHWSFRTYQSAQREKFSSFIWRLHNPALEMRMTRFWVENANMQKLEDLNT